MGIREQTVFEMLHLYFSIFAISTFELCESSSFAELLLQPDRTVLDKSESVPASSLDVPEYLTPLQNNILNVINSHAKDSSKSILLNDSDMVKKDEQQKLHDLIHNEYMHELLEPHVANFGDEELMKMLKTPGKIDLKKYIYKMIKAKSNDSLMRFA